MGRDLALEALWPRHREQRGVIRDNLKKMHAFIQASSLVSSITHLVPQKDVA